MRALLWLFRAAVFFALFAFALNNQHDAALKWFFGQEWRAPMVFIVLGAFALGCAVGIFAMLPSWWKHRRVARDQRAPRADVATTVLDSTAVRNAEAVAAFAEHPPRDGV